MVRTGAIMALWFMGVLGSPDLGEPAAPGLTAAGGLFWAPRKL